MNEKEKQMPSAEDFLPDEPPLAQEAVTDMPELTLYPAMDLPQDGQTPIFAPDPVILPQEPQEEALPEELPVDAEAPIEEVPAADTAQLPVDQILAELKDAQDAPWDAPAESNEEFMAQPAAQIPEEQQPRRYHAPRKGRPKRKGGYGLFGLPHLAATLVWLAIILMIGTSLGRMIWVCAADVLAFGRESKQVSVTITTNDTIDDIARKLHEAELVRYPEVFKLYAKLAVDEGDILPGTFQLDTIYDYHALVVQMGPRSSTRTVVEDLLIPEGLNCRQIFELLEQKNICTVRELEEYAANGEFSDFWFLEGVQRGDKYCLEGYLFPDTYDFYAGSTPREALGKMLTGFNNRVTEEYTQQLTSLNAHISAKMRADGRSEQYIADHQFTFRDVITVASLIEEETSSANESYNIASVIYNRLFSWGGTPAYLNIDAAIIYATGDPDNIDTSIDHPYNTYKHTGLTPGPITNPGLDSIKAALSPAETKYYYYVLNPSTGKHVFSRTLEEHEKYVKQFAQASEGQ